MARYIIAACLLVGLVVCPAAFATPFVGLVSDFNDGTTQGWYEGGASPNPPTVVPNGGPGGFDDPYLSNTSSGAGGAGARLVNMNGGVWRGDYVAAGVNRIQLDVVNFGPADLPLRVAFQRNTGERFVTSDAIVIRGDRRWIRVEFDISAEAMQMIGGGASYQDVMSDVQITRIMVASNSTWQGSTVAADMGFDNITMLPEPGGLPLLALGALLCRRRAS